MADGPDYLKTEEWKNYSLGYYPEKPVHLQYRMALIFSAFMTLGVIAGYLTHWLVFCLVTAFIVGVYVCSKVFPLKCPKCGGRVWTRLERSEEGEVSYTQAFHDCPKCQITWLGKKARISD